MSDEEARVIVDQALESGSIEQRNMVAVVVGIAGSGKTWLISRLFRINPPESYTSTGVAEQSFRGLMRHIATMDSWKLLSSEKILDLLAPFMQAGLPKGDIPSLAKMFIEEETQAPSLSTATAHPVQEKSHASETMISLVQTVEGSKKAPIIELIHMIDTGGQPEFMEIMPSLIHNSNLTLLVLNLDQPLDEYPHFAFYDDDIGFKRPLHAMLRSRQVICQLAHTLQAKGRILKGKHSGKFSVIGTHRDCVKGKLSKTLATLNKELKSIFIPEMENELIVYQSRNEIIFPVNLLNPDDDDEEVLKVIRQAITNANMGGKVEIPFSFSMFEHEAILYAKQKKGEDRHVMVLSFDECVQVGARLKMGSEVVQAALIYFHRHNVFLYFQHVLPNLVFLVPQVPLDFVNAIVALSYKVKSRGILGLDAKYERFCNEGIITEEMLCDKKLQLSDHFIPGIYEPQDAIKLFLHICTVAPLSNEEPFTNEQQPSAHSSRSEKKSFTMRKREYLMMSLLGDRCKKCIEEHLPSPSKVAPLVIHFSSGCVPNGCFGSTTSCLISTYKWKICQTEEGLPQYLAHNIVTLHDPKLPVTITLVNRTRHIEIHINMNRVEEEHFNEICLRIQKKFFDTIEKIFDIMRFEDIEVKSAVLCPCKCGPSHAATVQHLLGGSYMVCSKKVEPVGCLRKEQHFWFQDGKTGETFRL